MINKTFENIKTNKATGFVPYIVAHYPNRNTFKEALTLLAELNADVIEIGIPFTDPIAEGKVIEKAHHKVLEDNFNISDLLDDVKTLSLNLILHLSPWAIQTLSSIQIKSHFVRTLKMQVLTVF